MRRDSLNRKLDQKKVKWRKFTCGFLQLNAPAIAELLSGSAPPAEFFNPVRIIALVLLFF